MNSTKVVTTIPVEPDVIGTGKGGGVAAATRGCGVRQTLYIYRIYFFLQDRIG